MEQFTEEQLKLLPKHELLIKKVVKGNGDILYVPQIKIRAYFWFIPVWNTYEVDRCYNSLNSFSTHLADWRSYSINYGFKDYETAISRANEAINNWMIGYLKEIIVSIS